MATAQDVRDYAQANGLPAGGSKGRLPNEAIEAFNKGKRGNARYVPAAPTTSLYKVRKVGKDGRERTVKVKASPAAVREALRAAGHDVPERGRLSQELLDAYASLR